MDFDHVRRGPGRSSQAAPATAVIPAPKLGPGHVRPGRRPQSLFTLTPVGAVREVVGKGEPLPADLRAKAEARFGTSFAHVRLHDDAAAHEVAWSQLARAVTIGPDILFGAGQYRSGAGSGREILGHELAHVAQQGRRDGAAPAGPRHEAAAVASGRAFAGGFGPIAAGPAASPGLQRSPLSPEEIARRRRHGSRRAASTKPPKQKIYVKPPGAEELPEGTHSVVKSPPGSIAPKPETEGGIWAHENYEKLQELLLENAENLTTEPLRAGLGRESKIPDSRVPEARWQRIDRLDYEAGEVIEIKPEHLEAEGWAEAKTYTDYMNRFEKLSGGRLWKPRCVLYSQEKVITFLRQKGYLPALESPASEPGNAGKSRAKAETRPRTKSQSASKSKPKTSTKAQSKSKSKPKTTTPRSRAKAQAKPKTPPAESGSAPQTEAEVEIVKPAAASPVVDPAPATAVVDPAPATAVVDPAPATPVVDPAPTTPVADPVATGPPELTPTSGGPGVTSKVAGGLGVLALGGEIVKDLHEGDPGAAATAAGTGLVLSRLGIPGMIAAGTYGTIKAYGPDVQEHAEQFGDWVAGPNHPIIGGVAAAAEATGESVYKGVFKPVGTAIGEGLAAAYLELSKPSPMLEAVARELNRRAWQHKQREKFVAEQHRLEQEREIKEKQELEKLQAAAHSETEPAGISGRVVTHGSVGARSRNDPADVRRISARLRALGFLEADSNDKDELADAIRMYQSVVLGQRHPSGRVTPGDQTLRALSAGRGQAPMALP